MHTTGNTCNDSAGGSWATQPWCMIGVIYTIVLHHAWDIISGDQLELVVVFS